MYALPVTVNVGCCKARTDVSQFTVTINMAEHVNRCEKSAEIIFSFLKFINILAFLFIIFTLRKLINYCYH